MSLLSGSSVVVVLLVLGVSARNDVELVVVDAVGVDVLDVDVPPLVVVVVAGEEVVVVTGSNCAGTPAEAASVVTTSDTAIAVTRTPMRPCPNIRSNVVVPPCRPNLIGELRQGSY